MMNNDQNEMTPEEVEEDFKNAVADIFSNNIPGAYKDKDGFICIPKRRWKKNFCDTDNN